MRFSMRHIFGHSSFPLEPGHLPDGRPVCQDWAKAVLRENREHRRRRMDEGAKLGSRSTSEEVRTRDEEA